MVVPFLVGCLWRTPDTYHLAGIKRGTATSNFHVHRDNLTQTVIGCIERLGTHRLANGGSVTYFGEGIYRRCAALERLHFVVQYQPSSHFWAIQAAEGGIFLGLAGVFFALTVVVVK